MLLRCLRSSVADILTDFFKTSHPHLKVSVAHTPTREIESILGGVHWGELKQAARHCRTPDFSLLELEIERQRRGD